MTSKWKGGGGTAEEDLVEDADELDDHCTLSSDDVGLLVRLLGSATKTFHMLGTEFIERFKGACALSIGFALMTLYENHHRVDQLTQRLIACYLIYRIRDLESPPKKNAETEVIGHPFVPFLLTILDAKDSEELGFHPTQCERSFVERILARQAVEASTMTPLSFIDTFNLDQFKGDTREVRAFFARQLSRFPSALDMASASSSELPQEESESILHGRPSWSEESTADERRMFDLTGAVEGTTSSPDPEPGKPSEIMTVSASESPRRNQADAALSGIAEKALVGPLGPQERKVLSEALAQEAERKTEGPLTELFTQMSVLPKLVEDNASVAAAAVANTLALSPELVHRYVNVLLSMDPSVQCMEVIIKCYNNTCSLDREPLIAYVSYCIESCQGQDAQTHRLARAVCVFISSLIKNKILRVKDLSTELHEFCVRYTSVRETASLFQAVVAAKNEENKQLA